MDNYVENPCILGRIPKTGERYTCQPWMCKTCGFYRAEAARRERLIFAGKLTTCPDGLQRLIVHKAPEE